MVMLQQWPRYVTAFDLIKLEAIQTDGHVFVCHSTPEAMV